MGALKQEIPVAGISTDRKMRAGLMKQELETATCKTFSDAGDVLGADGKPESPGDISNLGGDDYYEKILSESRAKDAAIAAAQRDKAFRENSANLAKKIRESEPEVDKILAKWKAEEKGESK